MSANSTSSRSGSGGGGIRPLTSVDEKGQPYTRRAEIVAETERMLGLPRNEWAGSAPGLHSETLVFLIRYIRTSSEEWQARRSDASISGNLVQRMLIANEELLGGLVPELSKRVGRSAKRHAKGFDQVTTEELVWQVESEILELVLEKTPSRKGDFLEVAFNRGVMLQTLDAVEKYRNSMWAHSDRISEIGTVEDGEGVVHPIELIVDDRPNPLEVLLQKEEEIRLHELIEKAHDAVKDPRHLEALILRLDGWPLTDKDPSNPNLESYFGVSARQIENWIKKALKDMRAACDDSEESGDENDR